MLVGDQRSGREPPVVALLEEAQEGLADLVRGHTTSLWTSRPRAIGTSAKLAPVAAAAMKAQPAPNASSTSPGPGVPAIATHAASPSAAPIWRNMVCTAMPVARRSGGSVAAAVA